MLLTTARARHAGDPPWLGGGMVRPCRPAAPARGALLQRAAATPAAPSLAPPAVHEVLRAPGRPLDPATRAFMEPRFGHDFGRVRVHTDARAAASARAVNALAYTVGRNIVFDAGRYAPETAAGRRLLAHELAHVVQQGGGEGVLRRQINYIEQVTGAEAAPFLARFDASVATIETQIAGVSGPEADDLRTALARLRAMRAEGRVTCWRVSGGLVYASYDNATDQIRLHINIGNAAGSPSNLVHEAIHAVHAARYPRLARLYGETLAAGGTSNESIGTLLLKWKAWTEYWAYRRAAEFDNLRQAPEFRRDGHTVAMERGDVRGAIARVRDLTGQDFRPWEWAPPAQYRARPTSAPARTQ